MNACEPLVSTCIMTYQHQPYIRQAIDSVLAQECSFATEIIVCDDGSTDGTQEICQSYQSMYPDTFKLLKADANCGIAATASRLFMAARGRYIAICEGDDFWLDSGKLQKQVSFMEAHPEYTLTASNSRLISSEGLTLEETRRSANPLRLNQFLKYNFLGKNTASIVFRKDCIKADTMRFLQSAPFLDWAIAVACLSQGPGFCFSDLMSVYRKHRQGTWTGLSEEQQSAGVMKMQEAIATELSAQESHSAVDGQATG